MSDDIDIEPKRYLKTYHIWDWRGELGALDPTALVQCKICKLWRRTLDAKLTSHGRQYFFAGGKHEYRYDNSNKWFVYEKQFDNGALGWGYDRLIDSPNLLECNKLFYKE